MCFLQAWGGHLWQILASQNTMADDNVLCHKVSLFLRPHVPYAQHIAAAQGLMVDTC